MANASKTTNNITEDKVLRLPSKVTRDVINLLGDYYKGIHLEKLPIDKLVKDNDLLNDDDLQSYHKGEWKHANANDFHIDMDKINSIKTGNMPFVIKKKDGRLLISDGRHRTRAAYNDGYTHVEFPTYTEESLNEFFDKLDKYDGADIYATDSAYQLKNTIEKSKIPLRIYLWKNTYYFCSAVEDMTHDGMMQFTKDSGYSDWSDDSFKYRDYMVFLPKYKIDYYDTSLGSDDYFDCRVYPFGVMYVRDKNAYSNSLFKALGEPLREIHFDEVKNTVKISTKDKVYNFDANDIGGPYSALDVKLEALNEDKEDYQKKFDERTHAHIDRVNKYAKKINKEYPHHDVDKFNELYAGYSLMSKENVTEEEQKLIDDATFKHVLNNEHHCEHWCNPKDIKGFSRNNPTPHGCLDCSKMPEYALEEMCCDWCAMSEEFNNTPFEWYEKNKDTRWHFNEEQDKFILDTLHKLWDKSVHENLNESKQDIEKFRQWAGDELANRFFAVKDRLSGQYKDIYYWMSEENKQYNHMITSDYWKDRQEQAREYAHSDVISTLDGMISDIEITPTKRERDKLAKEGSKKIYEDARWLVVKINTYEASVKYGKHTQWCITGINSQDGDELGGIGGRYDFNDHSSEAKIYFYIDKQNNEKYALEIKSKTSWVLYDSEDFILVGRGSLFNNTLDEIGGDYWYAEDAGGIHPNFPTVQGLPDINAQYEIQARRDGYEGQVIAESLLLEKNRQDLLNKSRASDNYSSKDRQGENRYTRRLKSQIANSVRDYNRIDMDAFWKGDILDFDVRVHGETDDYVVSLDFSNILRRIQQEVSSNKNRLEFKCVLRALVGAFNSDSDLLVSCTCLHPDTKIKLLDGTNPTVEELEKRFNAGEKLYVYSADAKGDFKPGEVEKVWVTKRTTEFIKVTLDNGEEVITTPDHPYMLRDGTYRFADSLQVGQSLMPMYFNTANGYTLVKMNSEANGWCSVYKEVAKYYKQDEINEAEKRAKPEDNMSYKVAIHHADFNKCNNTPENLRVMTAREHFDYHASLTFDSLPKEKQEYIRQVSSENLKRMNANPTDAMIESRKRFTELGRLRNYDEDRKQQQSEIMKKVRKEYYDNMSEDESNRYKSIMSESTKNIWKRGCFNTQKFHEARIREGKRLLSNKDNQDKMMKCKMLKTLQSMIDDKVDLTEDNYNQYRKKNHSSIVAKYFKSFNDMISYFNLNHKVVKVERITLDETPVYDIKVKDWENFVVDAGVVLHNCPDWKYRQAYWATKGGYNSGQPQPSNGMAIANPNDTKGAGCKHVNLVLSNLDWMMKIASVINNYIKWTRDNMGRNYADYIFPKVYGMPYKKAVQLSLLDKEDKFGDAILPSDIDTINQAIERGMIGKDDQGKFVKGNEYRFQKTTKHQPEDNPDQMKLDLDNEEEDKEVNKSVTDIEKEKNVRFTKDEPQEPEEDKEANIKFEK